MSHCRVLIVQHKGKRTQRINRRGGEQTERNHVIHGGNGIYDAYTEHLPLHPSPFHPCPLPQPSVQGRPCEYQVTRESKKPAFPWNICLILEVRFVFKEGSSELNIQISHSPSFYFVLFCFAIPY